MWNMKSVFGGKSFLTSLISRAQLPLCGRTKPVFPLLGGFRRSATHLSKFLVLLVELPSWAPYTLRHFTLWWWWVPSIQLLLTKVWSLLTFYLSQCSLLPGLGRNALVKNYKWWLETLAWWVSACVLWKLRSAKAGGHTMWVLNKVLSKRRMKNGADSRWLGPGLSMKVPGNFPRKGLKSEV